MSLSRNISWTAFSQVIRQSLQIIIGIVLVRLLTPEDFGLIGLTSVFTGFAGLFSDLGLGAAIVQREDISEPDLNFVFWSSLLVGAVLTIVTILSAPLIAGFYHDSRLIKITDLTALSFAIAALGIVPSSLMQKSLRFKALAVADMVTVVFSGGIACWCAFRGFGVMSLVIQGLVAQVSSTILRWSMVKWHPVLALSWRAGRRLLPFGSGLLGSNLVNYWARNGDNLLIGKFCGAVQLGLYNRGYSLMMLPLMQIHSVLGSVLFPILSSMQYSKNEMRRVFLFANQGIAVVAFPLMLGLAVVADDFVKVLWGDRWASAVAIIRVLAIAGVANSIYTTVGWIYMATGRSDRMLWWTMVTSTIFVGSFALGLRWGALGVSIAFATTMYLVIWYPHWRLAGSLIDLSFHSFMSNLRGPLLSSLFMALGVLALRALLVPTLAPVIRLLVSVLAGVCLYVGALQVANVPAYLYMRERAISGLSDILKRAS